MIEFGDPYSPEAFESLAHDTAFEAELERIDSLVARSLKSPAAPAGLSERVFAASSALLIGGPQPLRFQPALARLARSAIWGRLALAASVVVAAMVGWPALTGTAIDSGFSDSVLSLAMGGAVDDADRFLNVSELQPSGDSVIPADGAYMDTFGIMGTEVDDVLGEMSLIDLALGS